MDEKKGGKFIFAPFLFKENVMANIEILSLKLGKWHTPRHESICDMPYGFVCAGCYDAFDISTIIPSDINNIYGHIQKDKDSDEYKGIYADRRIIMFRNIDSSGIKIDYQKSTIVSLINIDNSKVEETIKSIREIFKKYNAEEKYLIYYSFDYSDLVIVAQDIELNVFNSVIFDLNYCDTCEYVRDTFTMYGIPKEKAKSINKNLKIALESSFNVSSSQHEYIADFYLDVTEVEVLDEIKKELEVYGILVNITDFSFGRNDFLLSLPFDNDIHLICYLLVIEKLSITKDKSKLSINEIVLRTKTENKNKCIIPKSYNRDLNKCNQLSDMLYSKFDKYVKAYEEIYLNRKYRASDYWEPNEILVTIKEIVNSLIAFYKNGLAEEFLLCVLEPLISFFNYSIDFFEELDKTKEDYSEEVLLRNVELVKDYEEFLRMFFSRVQKLIHTTNYSDRRSLHINTFNSVYYDVSPKLLALYAMWAKEIAEEIGAERYTFLMSPTFTNYISLECISTQRESSNIVTITIGEKLLYSPLKLRQVLYHEIAHYVGQYSLDIRHRDIRKIFLIEIYLYNYFKEIFGKDWNDEFYEILSENLYEVLSSDCVLDGQFVATKKNYSEDIIISVVSIPDIIKDISLSEGVSKALEKTIGQYIDSLIKDNKIDEFAENLISCYGVVPYNLGNAKNINEFKKFLYRKIFSDFLNNSSNISMNNYSRDNLLESFEFYFYPFKEAFSDINMTLYMDMSEEEYDDLITSKITMKFNDQITSEGLRVYAVKKCMQDLGLWENQKDKYEHEDEFKFRLLVQYLFGCAKVIKEKTQKNKSKEYNGICNFVNADEVYNDIAKRVNYELENIINKLICKE